ncbi:MAG: ATP-binding protein [Bacteroidota bacterium]
MLIGRKKEITTLNEMLKSNSSELIAVYGRRRIGKTFLIRECYKKETVFEVTGYYRGSMKDQLRNFHTQLIRNSNRFSKVECPMDWFTAFELLENYLNRLRSSEKKVVFFDEFPWLATTRSKFLTAFEQFWNTYCTKRDDLVVVICGSAASFMINKVIRNKGGLHNRITCKISLKPFNLNETEQYLKSRNVHYTQFDILQLYMAIGGIPFYLSKIRKGESVDQSVDRLCFDNEGDLVGEFKEVFTSLFSNSMAHEKMIRVLAKTRKGITREELLKQCKYGSSGAYSKSLDELIESGFVQYYHAYGKKKKDSLYRLSDEYSLFYLKYIEPNRGQGSGTWARLSQKQTYRSWTGFTFESICLKHVQQIKKELGVDKIFSINSSWFNDKAQIDLLIDRDDRIINLCEIKFYDRPITISKKDYVVIRNKLIQFRENTGTRKNVFVVMMTTFGIVENAYSTELVTNSILMDSLFVPN